MPKQSSTPFTFYTFRFDCSDDVVIDKIKRFVIREIPKYALFTEVSSDVGKQHIQGKIGKALSEEQLRKHFKKEFPGLFVRSNYSISAIKDPVAYDSYICKDGVVLCNNVFSDEYIQEQVALREKNVAAFVEKKEKKKAAVSFTERVSRDFIEEFPEHVHCIQMEYYMYKPDDYEKKAHEASCKFLLSYILKRLGVVAKAFDDNVLQRMYNGIKNSIIQLDANACAGFSKVYESRIDL